MSSNITYVKGDLFELAPKGAYLAHACNCQGVWGSGIAVEFRKRFPDEYKDYVDLSLTYDEFLVGKFKDFGQVVCLFTSYDYGQNKDSVSNILKNTESGLKMISNTPIKELHMPKINSGLFGVPWEETEAILKKFDGKLKFVVYELE